MDIKSNIKMEVVLKCGVAESVAGHDYLPEEHRPRL